MMDGIVSIITYYCYMMSFNNDSCISLTQFTNSISFLDIYYTCYVICIRAFLFYEKYIEVLLGKLKKQFHTLYFFKQSSV
jgi:hypothetical protein